MSTLELVYQEEIPAPEEKMPRPRKEVRERLEKERRAEGKRHQQEQNMRISSDSSDESDDDRQGEHTVFWHCFNQQFWHSLTPL